LLNDESHLPTLERKKMIFIRIDVEGDYQALDSANTLITHTCTL